MLLTDSPLIMRLLAEYSLSEPSPVALAVAGVITFLSYEILARPAYARGKAQPAARVQRTKSRPETKKRRAA